MLLCAYYQRGQKPMNPFAGLANKKIVRENPHGLWNQRNTWDYLKNTH